MPPSTDTPFIFQTFLAAKGNTALSEQPAMLLDEVARRLLEVSPQFDAAWLQGGPSSSKEQHDEMINQMIRCFGGTPHSSVPPPVRGRKQRTLSSWLV